MSEKNFNEKIQEAIDSQNYGELSKSLQNLVTDAVTEALGELGDEVNKAADIIAGRKPIDRRPDYMKHKSHPVAQAQNPWMSEFDRRAIDYLQTKDLNGDPVYSSGGMSRLKGWLLAGIGLGGVFGCLTGLLVLMILGAFAHIGMAPVKIILAIMAVLFGVMSGRGFSILSRLKRFKKYIRAIGKKTKISVRELVGISGKKEKDTVKDVEKMIQDSMFLQGKLDLEKKNLYVTEAAYKEYIDQINQMQEEKNQAAILRMMGEQKAQAEQAEMETLPPEVQRILTDGKNYLEMFRNSNDAIADEAVSEKIAGLEVMTAQIFGYVKEHPQAAAETRKLMKYYLPTTEKLLDSYQKLTEAEESGLHPDQIPNIQKSKREIEETLDTLNQAFARLFDNLYQDTSMDISADISVLNTLLAQEGLVGDDIRKKEVEEEKGQVLQTF